MRGRLIAGALLVMLIGLVYWQSVRAERRGAPLGCYDAPWYDMVGSLPDKASFLSESVVSEPCDEPHQIEAYRRAIFTGAAAKASAPRDEAVVTQAQQVCWDAVPQFVGTPTGGSRLAIFIIGPAEQRWNAGARDFSCAVAEVTDSKGTLKQRSATLRDSLRGDRPLAIGCVKDYTNGGAIVYLNYVGCADAHSGEFVGSYEPDANADGEQTMRAHCDELASRFVGLTPVEFAGRGDLRTFWHAALPADPGVKQGTMNCFVGDPQRRYVLHGTVKDLGHRPVPTQ